MMVTALAVFAQKGPDGVVIDDFISACEVSRGTFYNHFKTTNELLLSLAAAMSDEVMQVVDPLVVQNFEDPVQRFTAGTRLYMQMALRYPLWATFIARVGTRTAARGQLIDICLTRDLSDAVKAKRLKLKNVPVGRDIVLGSIFYGIETMMTEFTHDHHSEHMVEHVLIGLGVSPHQAREYAFMKLPAAGPVAGPIFSGLKVATPPTRSQIQRPKSVAV